MRVLVLFTCIYSSLCFSGEIFTEFPSVIDPARKYVFYSHGFIVEGDDPTPVHPRWGVYDFPRLKQALSDGDYDLIAYHRPSGSDAQAFAQKLSQNVTALIESGVRPENISLVGFSRGGAITIFTSSLLARDDINYVILAGCGNFIEENQSIKMHGHVYSVIETSDDLVGSCKRLMKRSDAVTSFKELSISTGKEHGAFYIPIKEWVNPVKQWIKAKNS